jgi:hypothetical protein
VSAEDEEPMTQEDYARKLDELDSLLNDPDVPMDPARVWSLLADLSGRDTGSPAQRGSRNDAGAGAATDDGSAG